MPVRDVLERRTHHQRRRAARHFDALDAAAHAAARLVQRLAVLGRDDAGQFVEVLLEQRLEPVEDLRARVRPACRARPETPRAAAEPRLHVGGRRQAACVR